MTTGLIAYLNYVIYLQKPLPPIIGISLSCDYGYSSVDLAVAKL